MGDGLFLLSVRVPLADDGSAQVVLIICLQGMRRMALACQPTGEAHVHFVVEAGNEAVNFQIVDAQLEVVGLLFHKIVFLIVNAYYFRGFGLSPFCAQIICSGYSLTPAKALNESGAPSM